MNCIIKEIFIFNSKGEKRFVPLSSGLNVITGDSQTGKSALIEIVDYCLCSSSSTIPQGVITNFAYLFGVVLEFESKYIILARKKIQEGGLHKMYFSIETDNENINNIEFSYFETLEERDIKKDIQIEIERHLGLATYKMISDTDDDKEQSKATLRGMVSFLFQHQNLIANKHALFYRFDNYNKRKQTIDQFPIFMKWVDDKYFFLKRELDEAQKKVRQLKLSEKKQQNIQANLIDSLKRLFEDYYAIVGQRLPSINSFEDIINLQKELPPINRKSYVEKSIYTQYRELKNDLEGLIQRKILLDKNINEIEVYHEHANSYSESLVSLGNKNISSKHDRNTYNCPLCGQHSKEINERKSQLFSTMDKLKTELVLVGNYSDSYYKELEKLTEDRNNLTDEIKRTATQVKELEGRIKELKNKKTLNEAALYSKAKIDISIDEINKNSLSIYDDEIIVTEKKIRQIQEQISKFNLKSKENKAELFLAEKMNEICDKLDFEEEFKPINWYLKFDDFSLIYKNSKYGEISLSEMGSGSNWLACHLSLFMSFQWLFCKETQSTFPTFLFLDQPSQVYFPKEFDRAKDKDRIQVENIYIVILNELKKMSNEYKYTPQIIITDHADKLNLGEFNFEDYVRCRWDNEIGFI